MSRRSLLLLLIAAVVLVAASFAMRGHGAGMLHRWLPAMHGEH